jgi:predicted RNA-binding protein with PIN domain
VFDAAGAPPGLPHTLEHERMQIRFARRHSSADEMIEDLLEEHPAPRSLLVVSSDHRVQRAARRRGAAFVDSEEWYTQQRVARRQRDQASEESARERARPTAEELNYWLGEFGEPPAASDATDNPFPPGYADDLAEEDE